MAGGRAAGGGPLAPMKLKNRRPIGRPSTNTTGSAAGTRSDAQGDGRKSIGDYGGADQGGQQGCGEPRGKKGGTKRWRRRGAAAVLVSPCQQMPREADSINTRPSRMTL